MIAPRRVLCTLRLAVGGVIFSADVTPLAAQTPSATVVGPVARIVIEPARITTQTGHATPFTVTAYDAAGRVIAGFVPRIQGGGRNVTVVENSLVARQAGTFELAVTGIGGNGQQVSVTLPVVATWPPLARLEIVPAQEKVFTSTTVATRLRGWHADSSERRGITAAWSSSNSTVATVDHFGNVTGVRTGTVTIVADADRIRATRTFTVTTNPVARLLIMVSEDQLRTGDVIHLTASATTRGGAVVADAPVTWTYT